MASVNKAIIVGHLGKDPEVRYASNGDACANFSVATTETWKDKDGNKQEATEWHRVVLWRKLGEIAGQYLKKGSLVYIEGSIKTRKWQDKDGQDRYSTEIIGTEMRMLGGKPDGDDRTKQDKPARQPAPSAQGGFNDFEDDIPF